MLDGYLVSREIWCERRGLAQIGAYVSAKPATILQAGAPGKTDPTPEHGNDDIWPGVCPISELRGCFQTTSVVRVCFQTISEHLGAGAWRSIGRRTAGRSCVATAALVYCLAFVHLAPLSRVSSVTWLHWRALSFELGRRKFSQSHAQCNSMDGECGSSERWLSLTTAQPGTDTRQSG